MQLEINTPALLFPASTFLLLGYTNRYLALADLIRRLYREHLETGDVHLTAQISILRRRIGLIRLMQWCAVAAMLAGVMCMFTLYIDHQALSKSVFGASLILMMTSLVVSLLEIRLSILALDLQLTAMRDEHR